MHIYFFPTHTPASFHFIFFPSTARLYLYENFVHKTNPQGCKTYLCKHLIPGKNEPHNCVPVFFFFKDGLSDDGICSSSEIYSSHASCSENTQVHQAFEDRLPFPVVAEHSQTLCQNHSHWQYHHQWLPETTQSHSSDTRKEQYNMYFSWKHNLKKNCEH